MAKTSPKEIKRRLRELRADPGQPCARAEIQRLLGELRRAAQARDVTDMQGPANRRTAHRQSGDHDDADRPPRRPGDSLEGIDRRGLSTADREAIKTWPPELRRRLARW